MESFELNKNKCLRLTQSRWYFRERKTNRKDVKNLTCSRAPIDFGIPNPAEQQQMTNKKVSKIRMFIVQNPIPAKSELSGKAITEFETSQIRFIYA